MAPHLPHLLLRLPNLHHPLLRPHHNSHPHTGTLSLSLSLDARSLSITAVLDPDTPSPIPFFVSDSVDPIKGSELKVTLSNQTSFVVSYVTSPSSSALQWLSPPQTFNKTLPFCFTQCQAIHARSVFPCQDTLAARICYSGEAERAEGAVGCDVREAFVAEGACERRGWRGV